MTRELFALVIAVPLACLSVWAFRKDAGNVEQYYGLGVASGLVSGAIIITLLCGYATTLPTAWPSVWESK